MRVGRAIAAGLWALAIALRVNNAVLYPLDGTSDALLGHLGYVEYVHEHWRQPPTPFNWETWQPPLYYWTAAASWRLGQPLSPRPDRIKAPPQRIVIPLLSSLFGLVTAWLAVGLAGHLVPGDPLARLLALACILFLPMHVVLAPFVRNDLLAILLTSLVLVRLARVGDLAALSARSGVALGALVGLALLAKYTGSSILVVLGACLGLAALAHPARARGPLGTLAVAVAVAATLAGWFYADHWWRYGKAFVTPHDWLGTYNHPPGSRGLADFVRFAPAVFVHPWVLDPEVIRSVWAGTYATAWFDGQYIFLNHYMARPTAQRAGQVLLALGVVPTLAVGWGAVRAGRAALGERRLTPWVPLLLFTAWAVVAYVYLNVEVPYYSTVKAHYLLPAAVPLTAFFALGVAGAPRWLRALLAADVALLVVVTSVVFWFGLVR